MGDDMNRLAGEIGEMRGELRALSGTVEKYMVLHDRRHSAMDSQIEGLQADSNQQKGARGTLLTLMTVVSAAVGAAVSKWIH